MPARRHHEEDAMKTVTYTLAMVLLLSFVVSGCGRKGPLEDPPDDDRNTKQITPR